MSTFRPSLKIKSWRKKWLILSIRSSIAKSFALGQRVVLWSSNRLSSSTRPSKLLLSAQDAKRKESRSPKILRWSEKIPSRVLVSVRRARLSVTAQWNTARCVSKSWGTQKMRKIEESKQSRQYSAKSLEHREKLLEWTIWRNIWLPNQKRREQNVDLLRKTCMKLKPLLLSYSLLMPTSQLWPAALSCQPMPCCILLQWKDLTGLSMDHGVYTLS